VGFQLKGSGWYATDFKSSGKPAEKANGKNESDGAAKSTEKSGESKSDSSESKSTATAETSSTSSSSGCGGGCSCH
jgi:predicted nucleic acid-binding Zn ribbon protein